MAIEELGLTHTFEASLRLALAVPFGTEDDADPPAQRPPTSIIELPQSVSCVHMEQCCLGIMRADPNPTWLVVPNIHHIPMESWGTVPLSQASLDAEAEAEAEAKTEAEVIGEAEVVTEAEAEAEAEAKAGAEAGAGVLPESLPVPAPVITALQCSAPRDALMCLTQQWQTYNVPEFALVIMFEHAATCDRESVQGLCARMLLPERKLRLIIITPSPRVLAPLLWPLSPRVFLADEPLSTHLQPLPVVDMRAIEAPVPGGCDNATTTLFKAALAMERDPTWVQRAVVDARDVVRLQVLHQSLILGVVQALESLGAGMLDLPSDVFVQTVACVVPSQQWCGDAAHAIHAALEEEPHVVPVHVVEPGSSKDCPLCEVTMATNTAPPMHTHVLVLPAELAEAPWALSIHNTVAVVDSGLEAGPRAACVWSEGDIKHPVDVLASRGWFRQSVFGLSLSTWATAHRRARCLLSTRLGVEEATAPAVAVVTWLQALPPEPPAWELQWLTCPRNLVHYLLVHDYGAAQGCAVTGLLPQQWATAVQECHQEALPTREAVEMAWRFVHGPRELGVLQARLLSTNTNWQSDAALSEPAAMQIVMLAVLYSAQLPHFFSVPAFDKFDAESMAKHSEHMQHALRQFAAPSTGEIVLNVLAAALTQVRRQSLAAEHSEPLRDILRAAVTKFHKKNPTVLPDRLTAMLRTVAHFAHIVCPMRTPHNALGWLITAFLRTVQVVKMQTTSDESEKLQRRYAAKPKILQAALKSMRYVMPNRWLSMQARSEKNKSLVATDAHGKGWRFLNTQLGVVWPQVVWFPGDDVFVLHPSQFQPKHKDYVLSIANVWFLHAPLAVDEDEEGKPNDAW